jgi:hypothetical protein
MIRESDWEKDIPPDTTTAYTYEEVKSLESKGFKISKVNLKGTITMRVTSKNPNIQEIERCLRTR